ncbi:MAG: hypothetical protein PVF34_01640 [Gammaproteobacteria bacterium]|jgi:hypothetical protein
MMTLTNDTPNRSLKPATGVTLTNAMLLVLTVLGLTACSSAVNVKHPYVMADAGNDHVARVYFIRPKPFKYKGIADNKISVEYQNEKLLGINEGQYKLVKLKPSEGEVTTRSKTRFTNKEAPIDVSRSRKYRFIAGKTYFIALERVNEEFRGIFYDPAPVTYEQALQMAETLRPIGQATQEPIDEINAGKEAPRPSPLEPALPENLYPGKPYLIKGNPSYKPPEQPEEKNEMTFDQPPQQDDEANTSSPASTQ